MQLHVLLRIIFVCVSKYEHVCEWMMRLVVHMLLVNSLADYGC